MSDADVLRAIEEGAKATPQALPGDGADQETAPRAIATPRPAKREVPELEPVKLRLAGVLSEDKYAKRGGVRERRIAVAIETALREMIYIHNIDPVLKKHAVEIDTVVCQPGARHADVRWHALGDPIVGHYPRQQCRSSYLLV